MAEFTQAYQKIKANEGGYVNDPDDSGGETYMGVARKIHPTWLGWHIIDLLKKLAGFPRNLDSHTELQEEVERFYKVNYWNKINGSLFNNQDTANSIMDFAVNAGTGTSVKLAQRTVGVKDDGISGPNTVNAINSFDPDHFKAAFTVEKVKEYLAICKRSPVKRKYFFGWIDRAING